MRPVVLLMLVSVCVSVDAGTYQTMDGQRLPLKRNNGTIHPRSGELGPGKNLRWAGLEHANLQKANLRFADLRNASFEFVNLEGSTLHRAAVGGAGFGGANLKGCDLSGAQLDGADFRGSLNWKDANWKNASYLRGVEPRWPEGFCPKSVGIQVEDPPDKKE